MSMSKRSFKTTVVAGRTSVGKTHALQAFAIERPGELVILSTSDEPGMTPFTIEAAVAAGTPYLAIDELDELGEMSPAAFKTLLSELAGAEALKHLILVSCSERFIREAGFILPRGCRTLVMRERRMRLVEREGEFFVEAEEAQPA